MPHPSLVILGYSEAGMFLRERPQNCVGIISIHGAREFGVESAIERRLDLAFDDTEVTNPNDSNSLQRVHSRERWCKQIGLVECAPTPDHAAAIIEFAASFSDSEGYVLCHCGAGISRSPAAALICLTVWRGPGTELECAREIQQTRLIAAPHTGLIRFADDLLGRDGRLIRAVAETFQSGDFDWRE